MINKMTAIGNVTSDPETKFMPNGDPICTTSIACNESWKDKQTGQKVEKVEFINLKFTKRTAEVAQQYLAKGSQIYIEGKFRTDSWDDKNTGQKRYKTYIQVMELKMLGSRQAASISVVPATQPAHDIAKNYAAEARMTAQQSMQNDPIHDDIPF